MNIKFITPSVEIITDENWGSTWESNLETMAVAMGVCRGNDFSDRDIEKLVFEEVENGRPSVLNFSNVEIKDFAYFGQLFKFSFLTNTDGRTQKMRDFMTYFEPPAQTTIASLRDIWIYMDGYKEYWDDFIKTKSEKMSAWINDSIFIPRTDPNKRLMMKITTSREVGHHLRTETSLSHFALSLTSVMQDKTSEAEKVWEFCEEDNCHNRMSIAQSLAIYHDNIIFHKNRSKCNLGDDLSDAEARQKAKVYIPSSHVSRRVCAGSVCDFIDVCKKRLNQTPKSKTDIRGLFEMMKNAVEEWRAR